MYPLYFEVAPNSVTADYLNRFTDTDLTKVGMKQVPKQVALEDNRPQAKTPTPIKKDPVMDAIYLNSVSSSVANDTIELKTKRYLAERLHEAQYVKEDDLRKAFGLKELDPPETPEELVARIKEDKYTIEEGKEYYSAWQRISWRDPAVKKDMNAFKAAVKAMYKAKEETQDTIMVFDNETGLKALQAFETGTFH